MITVGYFDGISRRGLLAWRETEEGIQAIGGVSPEDQGYAESGAKEPLTVVSTDDGDRVLFGWVHPDDIREISGQDGPEVVVQAQEGDYCSWSSRGAAMRRGEKVY